MKQILLFCLFFISIYFISAQDWPVGTIWVYDQTDYGPYDPDNFAIVKITKDTIIQNQNAKELRTYYWRSSWDSTQIHWSAPFFIKADSGRVSLWDPDSSNFLLIYDFNLLPGDTVNYYIGPYFHNPPESDFVQYRIDSIKLVQTSGPLKKRFFYHKTGGRDCFFYYNTIIEDIGCTSYFFQTFCAVDPPPGGGLDCFSSGSFHYPKDYNCKLPTGLNQLGEFKPTIYPNPSTGIFSIRDLDINEFSFEIYNQLGQCRFITKDADKIDIGNLSSGIYILKLKNKTKSYCIKINKI